MSTTVRRNATRQIAEIRANFTTAVVKSLDNGFQAQPVTDLDWMWNQYQTSHNATLYRKDTNGTQHYVISIHGNLWYELRKS